MNLDRVRPFCGDHPIGGAGYIAGEVPGIVSLLGVPASRRVSLVDAATLRCIARHVANRDGTYRFDGMSPRATFKVIAEDWSGTYMDVIVSRVSPVPYDVRAVTGAFTANNAAHTLDGMLTVDGGIPAYTVAVTSGAAPLGLTFSVIVGTPPTYAAVGRYVVANGTTSAGTYAWTLTVTAANGSSKSIACSATFT